MLIKILFQKKNFNQSKMSFKKGLEKLSYNLFFRRTSLYIVFILAGSIAAERGVHMVVDTWWANKNKGVKKKKKNSKKKKKKKQKLFSDMVVEYKERGIIQEESED